MARISKVIIAALLFCAVCGAFAFLGYSTLKYRHTADLAVEETIRTKYIYLSNLMLYGIVESADPETRVVGIRTNDPYTPGAYHHYRLRVADNALISRQEITTTPDGLTAVSVSKTPTVVDLGTLQPGDKIKFLIGTRVGEGEFSIIQILTGDPL